MQYIICKKSQVAGDKDCMTKLIMTYWGMRVILQMSLTVAFVIFVMRRPRVPNEQRVASNSFWITSKVSA